jgi:hypothetical protein
MRENEVGRQPDEFHRVPANLGGIVCGPADVDPQVAPYGPA